MENISSALSACSASDKTSFRSVGSLPIIVFTHVLPSIAPVELGTRDVAVFYEIESFMFDT